MEHPIKEENYASTVINDIKMPQSKYYTRHYSALLVLKDLTLLINICTFIAKLKWYEMLETIAPSRTGCHFILKCETEMTELPVIVSSAKIQSWNDSSQWLYFTPFFKPRQESAKNLENHPWNSLHITDKICEVLRLTVNGSMQQCAFYLYLTQKRLMKHLDELGYKLTLTIIEQPWMIRFYNTLQLNWYSHTSRKDFNDTRRFTFKGAWVVPNLRKELDSLCFRKYKPRIIIGKERGEID